MIKVLTYHSIGNSNKSEIGNNLYCTSEKDFREQIQYLRKNKDKVIALTFDDGCESSHKYVFPILKEAGFIAYFFVIASKVGSSGYMNWQQVKELRDAGMIIGSHGMTHRILTELSDEDLDYELKESKRILESNLKQSINYFSIPRGFYNKKFIEKAKDCGYKAVFTSSLRETGSFKVGRIAVKSDWDLGHFIQVANKGYSLQDKAIEFIKDLLKKALGAERYDQFRTWILSR
ncbi:polysaccharide deacetylase family protein [Candidatus Omnitrophota bacterium]